MWNRTGSGRPGGGPVPAVLTISLAALALGAYAQAGYSFSSPRATVEALHRGLVEVAADDALASTQARFERLDPLIRATHDLRYIAEMSVRRDWPSFSDDQQERMAEAFAELSIMTYAARFANVSEQSFEIRDVEEISPERAEVHSVIKRANGEEVTLDYLLHHDDAGWQIINIIADGVSDLALKRSEYRRILAEDSTDGLIGHIEDQTREVRD
jgi:phospholipid transport system substrate-binding protein